MKKILFIFFLFILLPLIIFAESEEKVVKIVTLGDYAPFCSGGKKYAEYFVSPGTTISDFNGYCWDVVKESYHEMGYSIKLTVVPWTRVIFLLEENRADIVFPIGRNSERLDLMFFSEEPVNPVSYVAYSKKDKNYEWKGLDSLKGHTVGVKKGFNYGNKWLETQKMVKVYEVNTILQGFTMLQGGRFDFYLGYEYNWDYVIDHNRLSDKFVKYPPFFNDYEYLAALKSSKKGRELLKIFDEGKKRLIKKGKIKELQDKWFGKYDPKF